MSYLTQALIDYEAAARAKMSDIYDWHQLAWSAFPGPESQVRDFLTRLDRLERERQFRLLIVSSRPSCAPELWPEEPDAWQVREIMPSFFTHRYFRFQLRANVTKRDSQSRKRVPLRASSEQTAWILRKAGQSGFVVDSDALKIIPEGREWFHIEKRGHAAAHHSVEFEGVLTVTDQPAFQRAFATGIGSAKSFGFGLLALRPLRFTDM